jgi:hypothetical protein
MDKVHKPSDSEYFLHNLLQSQHLFVCRCFLRQCLHYVAGELQLVQRQRKIDMVYVLGRH